MKKIVGALLAPLLLSGCFLAPGKFASALDLRRDGTFSFSYLGEVVFQSPEDMVPGRGDSEFGETWSDDQAYCTEEKANKPDAKPTAPAKTVETTKATEAKPATTADATDKKAAGKAVAEVEDDSELFGKSRPCTPKEIAQQKAEWESNRAAAKVRRAEEAKAFGTIFGFTPGDDAANRRFAALLAKYDGYRSVTYKGAGVFQIDYQKTGRLDHDFLFPLLPASDIVFPFVTVKRQTDGAVRVSAPSLIGGGMKAFAARMQGLTQMGGGKLSAPDKAPPSRADGKFTVTTDGEVLTNNTEDGPTRVAAGRQLVWTIGPDSDKVPEALIGTR